MSKLLLVLPVEVKGKPNALEIEAQAHNGLRLYLEHFDAVVATCVYRPATRGETLPISTIVGAERLRVIPLSEAWLPHQFAARLPAVSRLLADEIDQAEYLLFGVGGLWGDWASVAAIIAALKHRAFAVWTDHVESNVHFARASSKRGVSRLYTTATAALMTFYERAIIRRADLGLFHGADCFHAYAGISKNPHLVHNIHIGLNQHISLDQLRARLKDRSGPLKLAYAGRASSEKGTLDWVEAMSLAAKNDVDIEATWFGTGPEFDAAKQKALQINAPVHFPGAVPHSNLLNTLKTFDAFVFCHKTLESPRCLIEALACGLPIVGYRSPYPEDLLYGHSGGILVEQNSIELLARAITSLSDLERLETLSLSARDAGSRFTDEAVFKHRADLMKGLALPEAPVSASSAL